MVAAKHVSANRVTPIRTVKPVDVDTEAQRIADAMVAPLAETLRNTFADLLRTAMRNAGGEYTTLISIGEAARRLDVDTKTVRTMIAGGELGEVMIRSHAARVRAGDVEELIGRKAR